MGGFTKALFIVFFILILIFLLLAIKSEGGQNQTDQWQLLDKIKEGRELLKSSPPLKFVERNGRIVRKEVALAILNIETGKVFERRYWLDEVDIDKATYLRNNYLSNSNNLPRFMPKDIKEMFIVITNWWNSFNSDFSIVTIDNPEVDIYVVIDDKYILPNGMIHYKEDRTGKKYSDIVYAPYSKGVHDADTVKRGSDFMKEKVEQAFDKLKTAKVMSKSYPNKLIVDTIRPISVLNLLVTEQTDPANILKNAITEDERRVPAERVLVRYGLNGDETFRYTYSSTRALGPAQIMPLTYSYPPVVRKGRVIRGNTGMVQQYPSANLIKDVNIGRIDVVNAIMAGVLVLDDHLCSVKNRVYKKNKNGQYANLRAINIFEAKDEDALNIVRAMVYNGGPGKYMLSTGNVNPQAKGARETIDFVRKYEVIRDLKLFN